VAGEPIDLAGLWRDLGVAEAGEGSVALRDDAAQAAVRKGIAAGGGH
jgi:hypothetical protein